MKSGDHMVKNKKQALDAIQKVKVLKERVSKLSSDTIDIKIENLWFQVRFDESVKQLKNLPIELLDLVNETDLPLKRLIEDKIENIHSATPLGSFYGKTAMEATIFSDRYRSHIFPSLAISRPLQADLIRLLVNYDSQEKEIKLCKENFTEFLNTYEEQLDAIVENDTNPMFRLFQDKIKKEKIIQAKEFIKNNSQQLETIVSKVENPSSVMMPYSFASKTFEEDKVQYYEKLKEVTNYQPNEVITNIPYYLKDKLTEAKRLFSNFSSEKLDNQIKNQWEKLKEPLVDNELKNMSLSVLNLDNADPYPIDKLNIKGYHNLYDIIKVAHRDKDAIVPVSQELLDRLYEDSLQVKESIANKIFPRFNIDKLILEEVELLKLIYTRIHVDKEIQSKQQTYQDLHKKLTIRLAVVENLDVTPYELLFVDKDVFEQLNSEKQAILTNLRLLYRLIEEIKQVMEVTVSNQEVRSDFAKNSPAYYALLESVTGIKHNYSPSGLPDFIVSKVNEFKLNTNGLKGVLRTYQEFGTKYALYNKRTLLGDEMGLGKTMQAIAMMNHLHKQGKHHSLVVVPLSIMANWKREIRKWSSLEVFVYHGSNGYRQREQALSDWKEQGGVLLTTYHHTLRFEREDMKKLTCLVVDEAHQIKNPSAKRSQRIYKISDIADYILYMTGTPIENRLDEMKQLITILKPDLGKQFRYQMDLNEPDNFKKFVSFVYLRRKRDEVLQELPEIEVVEMWSKFSEIEQVYYDDAVRLGVGGLQKMRRSGFFGQTPSKSEKLEQLLQICEEAHENGHKVLVFSFFRDVLKVVQEHLGSRTFEIISGDVPNTRRQEIIDQFTEAQPGSVLVSQIEAGGVGLNIQAANIVILCEPQWKPSIENQAISRVYRMGQTRNVIVYRLLSEDSIDETMIELLGYKMDIFNLYARDSEVANAYDRTTKGLELPETQNQSKVFEVEKARLEEKEGVLVGLK